MSDAFACRYWRRSYSGADLFPVSWASMADAVVGALTISTSEESTNAIADSENARNG